MLTETRNDQHRRSQVTAEQFRTTLQALDLTVEGFAAITGQHRTTCQNWGRPRSGRGVQAFPRWVELLLREWRAHGVPEAVVSG